MVSNASKNKVAEIEVSHSYHQPSSKNCIVNMPLSGTAKIDNQGHIRITFSLPRQDAAKIFWEAAAEVVLRLVTWWKLLGSIQNISILQAWKTFSQHEGSGSFYGYFVVSTNISMSCYMFRVCIWSTAIRSYNGCNLVKTQTSAEWRVKMSESFGTRNEMLGTEFNEVNS